MRDFATVIKAVYRKVLQNGAKVSMSPPGTQAKYVEQWVKTSFRSGQVPTQIGKAAWLCFQVTQ